jgi:asparagine synthase (glutamine-hydrolysing)
VLLSGGLDSSAVVALLSSGRNSGLKAFSVGYDFGPEYDEISHAHAIAKRFSADHYTIRLSPKVFRDSIPRHIWHMDEPVADAAAISLHHVAKIAREHVAVVLSGEGADELFAGYDFYRYNLIMNRCRHLFGGATFRGLASLPPRMRRLAKLRKYIRLTSEPLEKRYHGNSTYDRNIKEELYSSSFTGVAALGNSQCAAFADDLFRRTETSDPLSRMLYFDCKTWLVDDLLIKADRMTMANSLELRVPFLDHRLVEYAASTPSRYKIRGATSKYVLKKALEDDLPRQTITRKKMGFPTPLKQMFRGELFEYTRDTLLSSDAVGRGYFDQAAVRRLLEDHHREKAANHIQIWQLLVLEEWHRSFSY